MNPHEQGYPWMFHRDEIDLLEDELEDLYETFPPDADPPTFETMVMREQWETEEQSEQELTSRLEGTLLEPLDPSLFSIRQVSACSDSDESWHHEMVQMRIHPFFQEAKRWVTFVKPLVKQRYEQAISDAPEWFRIYANLNMVLLKIFTGLCEERHGGEVGETLAWEAYQLAHTYVGRVAESFRLVSFCVEPQEWITQSRGQAEALRDTLAVKLKQV
ncbi:hypothetical protein HY733_01550 [Candidatus Uhrbacteria bacterium]|nr:hypothetical protein [Candidatus Uhrbacteria bacterium]